MNCTSGSCTVNDSLVPIVTGLKARLITGEEVSNIVKLYTNGTTIADDWSLSNSREYYFSSKYYLTGTITNGTGDIISLSWLLDNTNSNANSGATINAYGSSVNGYWTLSPFSGNNKDAFSINQSGSLGNSSSNYYDRFGARPVITVPKTDLSFN